MTARAPAHDRRKRASIALRRAAVNLGQTIATVGVIESAEARSVFEHALVEYVIAKRRAGKGSEGR